MSAQHTPGPWSFSATWRPPVGRGPHSVNQDGNIFWGYSISGCDDHGTPILPTLAAVHNFPDNVLANARLLAAAPDLLEALDAVRRVLPATLKQHDLFQAVEDAIAKAAGDA